MILTIDIGNTHLKFAVFNGGKIVHEHRFPTSQFMTFPNLNEIFPNVSNWKIQIACVAQIHKNEFSEHLKKIYQCEPHWLSAKSDLPFRINLETPQTVGADRLAHIAAVYQNPGNWLVIDMGTFLTFDYYKENQGFMGGAFFPGITATQSIYTEKSSQLSSFVIRSTDACYGNETLSAMQAGLYHAYKYILKGFIADFAKISDGGLQIVATGGGWSFLQKDFSQIPYEPHLTLKGLNNLVAEN